jgi:hypothetical protein
LKESFKNQTKEKPDFDQYLLLPIFFILLVIATVESRADDASGTNSVQIQEIKDQAEAAPKKFELTMAAEYSSNLMSNSNPDKDADASLIIKPVYAFSEKTNLAARVDLIQDFDSDKTTKASNTALILQPTKMDLNKEISFTPNLAISLPTDKTQRYQDSYRGTFSLRPTVDYVPSKIPGLTLSNGIFLSRLFHGYEFKRDYSANNEYSIRNRLIVAYEWKDKWSLELTNDYVRAWTYKGYANDAFYFAQELAYQFIKNSAVYVSHKNEGSARGPNNNGDNVEIYNAKSSYVSLGLSHVF